MKRTDIALIVLIAAASAGIAYFVASSVLGGITEQSVKVKTVDPITSTVETPDSKIFNENAINPSVEVTINNTEDPKKVVEDNAVSTPSTQTGTGTGTPNATTN